MENLQYKPSLQNDFSYYMSFHVTQIEEFADKMVTDREEDRFSNSYRDIINQFKERRND
jgi:DNA-binding ferritin-like protein (Dps family)